MQLMLTFVASIAAIAASLLPAGNSGTQAAKLLFHSRINRGKFVMPCSPLMVLSGFAGPNRPAR